MQYIDDDIFRDMEEFKDNFFVSIHNNFVRFNNIAQKERLAAVYERVFGRKSGILNGCSRCLLNDTKALARVYYDYEAKKAKAVEEQPEPTEANPTEPKEVKPKPKNKRATKKAIKTEEE